MKFTRDRKYKVGFLFLTAMDAKNTLRPLRLNFHEQF